MNNVGCSHKSQSWRLIHGLLAFGGLALVLSLWVLTRPTPSNSEGKEEAPEVIAAAQSISDGTFGCGVQRLNFVAP